LALEAKRDEVLKYKEMGLNMNAIAKLLGVSRHSVKKFLARFPIVNGKYKD
jgi:transposase